MTHFFHHHLQQNNISFQNKRTACVTQEKSTRKFDMDTKAIHVVLLDKKNGNFKEIRPISIKTC